MKFILFFLAAILVWGGGQDLHVALTNRKPVELTLVDYVSARPDAKWLQLKNCQLDFSDASYFESSAGTITDLFIPVGVPGEEEGSETVVLLSSTTPESMEIFDELQALSSEDAMMAYVATNADRVFQKCDLEGLIQSGLSLSSDKVEQLQELNPGLAEDFVILAEDEQPNLVRGGVMFVIGLLLLVWLLRGFFRKGK